jgi:hypothetical protein
MVAVGRVDCRQDIPVDVMPLEDIEHAGLVTSRRSNQAPKSPALGDAAKQTRREPVGESGPSGFALTFRCRR